MCHVKDRTTHDHRPTACICVTKTLKKKKPLFLSCIVHCYHNHIQERNHGHTGVTRENKVVNSKANVLSYKIQDHVYVRYIRVYLLLWNVGTSSNLSSHAGSKNQFSKTSYSWSCNGCTSKLRRIINAYITIIIIIIIIIISRNIAIDGQRSSKIGLVIVPIVVRCCLGIPSARL